jgi:hypothetical protein
LQAGLFGVEILPIFTIWDEEDINTTNIEMGRRNKDIVIGAKSYKTQRYENISTQPGGYPMGNWYQVSRC